VEEGSLIYNHEQFKVRLRDEANILVELVGQKNLAYGNSYEVVPAIIKLLYPNGCTTDQMDDMLLMVRLLDKLKRIVENNDPMGEDPWQDVCGYALLKLTTRPKEDPQPSLEPRCSSECTGRCAGCENSYR
jgi:hypothetical protein